MIRKQNDRCYEGICHFFGLSTDTKPSNTVTGSDFYEIDTGKTYHFNEETSDWVAEASIYLKSISVSGATTSYTAGQSFSTTGLTVTATYTDNSSKAVTTSVTITPSGALTTSDTKVYITYEENGIRRQSVVNITVTRNVLTIPSQSGTVTYDGTEKTATFANYDATKMAVSGNKATNAGTYTAVFTILDPTMYEWSDHTIESQDVSWAISKASSTITLSENSVSLSDETPSAEVTASSTSTGAISVSSSAEEYATAEISNGVITITKVAAGSAAITVSGLGDANHNAPSNQTITVTVE